MEDFKYAYIYSDDESRPDKTDAPDPLRFDEELDSARIIKWIENTDLYRKIRIDLTL